MTFFAWDDGLNAAMEFIDRTTHRRQNVYFGEGQYWLEVECAPEDEDELMACLQDALEEEGLWPIRKLKVDLRRSREGERAMEKARAIGVKPGTPYSLGLYALSLPTLASPEVIKLSTF